MEAYTAAMRGQLYPTSGLQQQRAAYAASTLRQQQQQQQPSRPGSPYLTGMQPHQLHLHPPGGQLPSRGVAIGGMQPQAGHMQMQMHASPYNGAGNQMQHVGQATPDRLGITPMQLAMLQQQRLQQGGITNLFASPSIHSVTSSGKS